jgi:iron complex outermembrane recepter protein
MSFRRTEVYLLLAGVSIAALSAAGPVRAEDATVLDQITVEGQGDADAGFVAESASSATKTRRPLIKTPQAVSVINRKEFEERTATSAQEALRYTAGVSADLRPNDRYDIVPVRNFGGYQNFVQYLDGLRILKGISYAEPTIDIYDLERIEVVKGPSSVLYGQMTPGGLVNLVSKKPTEEEIRETELTFGTDNYLKAGIDIGGKANEDGSVLYRFVASGRYNESNIDGVDSRRVSVSPSLEYKPDDGTSLTLLFNYSKEPSSSYPGFLPAQGTAYANGAYGYIPYDFDSGDSDYDTFTRETARVGYEFEHQINDYLTFRQNLRFSHIDTYHQALYFRSISGSTLNRGVSRLDEHANTLAVDNQLEADFKTGALDHVALMGIDYQYIYATRLMGTGLAPSIDYLNPDYDQAITTPAYTSKTRQTTQQAGIYAQDQIEFGKLNLAAGGRYDRYSIDADTTTLSSGTVSNSKQDNQAFTGRVGATYLFDNGIAPYASYSTSFEPPSGLGYSASGGTVLKPVTGEQYELGVKYQPEGWDSSLTVSLYDLTQKNAVSSDSAHSGYYVQTGEVHSRGVEVEGKLALGSGWNMTAAYTYTDAEVTESATPAYVGNTPTGVARNTASLWLRYAAQTGPLEGLGIGGGVRYVGSTYGDDANSFKVPQVTLFDAAISYDFGARNPKYDGLTLNVAATNLFDKEYVASCSATTRCFYGTGRSVLATLKYSW